MKKSNISPMPDFFDRYINQVEDIDIHEALSKYAAIESYMSLETIIALDGKRYAPGKWTIKEILQHIIDTERILSYRALRFARKDKTSLPGFDEELFAQSAEAEERSIPDLIQEYKIIRKSSIALFKSFNDEMFLQDGICFNRTLSVVGLGFVIVGHSKHHFNVIKERYLPLLS
jgi:hypothetical protein